jgi:hypothetical protein
MQNGEAALRENYFCSGIEEAPLESSVGEGKI